MSDAEVIVNKLLEHGVPKDAILFEKNSLHSIANVMEAKKILILQRLISYYLFAKFRRWSAISSIKNIYLKLLLVSHIHLIQVSMVSLSLIDIIGWKMKKVAL